VSNAYKPLVSLDSIEPLDRLARSVGAAGVSFELHRNAIFMHLRTPFTDEERALRANGQASTHLAAKTEAAAKVQGGQFKHLMNIKVWDAATDGAATLRVPLFHRSKQELINNVFMALQPCCMTSLREIDALLLHPSPPAGDAQNRPIACDASDNSARNGDDDASDDDVELLLGAPAAKRGGAAAVTTPRRAGDAAPAHIKDDDTASQSSWLRTSSPACTTTTAAPCR
jgi:hypothetical protein